MRASGVDRVEFERFYRETAVTLRGYLRVACRNVALADDLLQESYLRLLRQRLPRLDPTELRAYLYRTARSVLADHYRARDREERWRVKAAAAAGVDPLAAGSAADPGVPADSAFELPTDMQRVFDELNTRQQTLLWLAYVEGFTHEEIARVLEVGVGSVRVLLSRARSVLATKLRELDLAPADRREIVE